MPEPRVFTVIRRADESGVSGTGRVLDGIIFHTGQVVVCWRGDVEAEGPGYSSLSVFPCWDAFRRIHLDAHPDNEAQVIFGKDCALREQIRSAGVAHLVEDERPAPDDDET